MPDLIKGQGKKSFQITRFIGIIIIAMVVLQILAFLLKPLIPQAEYIKLGPGFIIFGVGIAVIIPFYLIFKRGEKGITGRDIFMVVVSVAVVLFLTLGLKQFLPEIFSSSAQSLMAILGG